MYRPLLFLLFTVITSTLASTSNMPITEFATLSFNTSISSPPIPELLKRLNTSQSAWSGYPVLLHTDTSNSNIVYLISGWESVPAHEEWITSDENQELLRLLGPFVQITGFSHLTANFDEIPRDEQGFMVVSKVEDDIPEKAVWTGQGVDLEDEKRPVFWLAFYHDKLCGIGASTAMVMERLMVDKL